MKKITSLVLSALCLMSSAPGIKGSTPDYLKKVEKTQILSEKKGLSMGVTVGIPVSIGIIGLSILSAWGVSKLLHKKPNEIPEDDPKVNEEKDKILKKFNVDSIDNLTEQQENELSTFLAEELKNPKITDEKKIALEKAKEQIEVNKSTREITKRLDIKKLDDIANLDHQQLQVVGEVIKEYENNDQVSEADKKIIKEVNERFKQRAGNLISQGIPIISQSQGDGNQPSENPSIKQGSQPSKVTTSDQGKDVLDIDGFIKNIKPDEADFGQKSHQWGRSADKKLNFHITQEIFKDIPVGTSTKILSKWKYDPYPKDPTICLFGNEEVSQMYHYQYSYNCKYIPLPTQKDQTSNYLPGNFQEHRIPIVKLDKDDDRYCSVIIGYLEVPKSNQDLEAVYAVSSSLSLKFKGKQYQMNLAPVTEMSNDVLNWNKIPYFCNSHEHFSNQPGLSYGSYVVYCYQIPDITSQSAYFQRNKDQIIHFSPAVHSESTIGNLSYTNNDRLKKYLELHNLRVSDHKSEIKQDEHGQVEPFEVSFTSDYFPPNNKIDCIHIDKKQTRDNGMVEYHELWISQSNNNDLSELQRNCKPLSNSGRMDSQDARIPDFMNVVVDGKSHPAELAARFNENHIFSLGPAWIYSQTPGNESHTTLDLVNCISNTNLSLIESYERSSQKVDTTASKLNLTLFDFGYHTTDGTGLFFSLNSPASQLKGYGFSNGTVIEETAYSPKVEVKNSPSPDLQNKEVAPSFMGGPSPNDPRAKMTILDVLDIAQLKPTFFPSEQEVKVPFKGKFLTTLYLGQIPQGHVPAQSIKCDLKYDWETVKKQTKIFFL